MLVVGFITVSRDLNSGDKGESGNDKGEFHFLLI